jgi:hypothetical protein
MTATYVHTRVRCRPRQWSATAQAIGARAATDLAPAGGTLYGVWRSQIGRPRDELTVISTWPSAEAAERAEAALVAADAVAGIESEAMRPTLRPKAATPPTRQGNYAFRWFELAADDWPEFLELCAAAWPGFEAAYDSEVIGLWRLAGTAPGRVRSLLLTRRPDLAMWERSKLPEGEAEAEVRRKLSRRYDLCDWTVVYTATLLTATDHEDRARWT